MSNQRLTRAASARATGVTRHKAVAKQSDSPPVAKQPAKKVTTKRRASKDAEEFIPHRDRITGRKLLAAALAKEREAEAKEEKRARAAAKTAAKRAADKEAKEEKRVRTAAKRAADKIGKSFLKQVADEELPHNLGPLNGSSPHDEENQPVAGPPGRQLTEAALKYQTAIGEYPPSEKSSPHNVKWIKDDKGELKLNKYHLTPGRTPFNHWPHPTPEECEVVNTLLSSVHGQVAAPKEIPPPSLTVTGCGEVPSVLDALIRTLLSGATTFENAAKAFSGLVQRFGILQEGIGKGSVDWDAVRRAPFGDVFDAIKPGGLAMRKATNLRTILDTVYEENMRRLGRLNPPHSFFVLADNVPKPSNEQASNEKPSDAKPSDEKPSNENPSNENPSGDNETDAVDSTALNEKVEKDLGEYEIACGQESFLSLNHLHALSSKDAMNELLKFPGVGPKTAACVILFCLQRPCFAVDTHIFRLSQWLGWVPPDDGRSTVNEVTTFNHLEVRVPDHFKYSLHQLFIRHGKDCPRCRAITGEQSVGWNEGCVIDHLVNRVGHHKPGGLTRAQMAKKNKVKPGGTKHKGTKPNRARAAKKIKTGLQPENLPYPMGPIDPDETELDPDLTLTDPEAEISDYSRAPSDVLANISD
ncbi:hypothetical protein N7466_010024 [Penicillium verhagenii]|uniref:uncharacterized protein n=1 Tax=Penicillium verhagenii TaxID=1562060 RepID=UPI002544F6FD|nr:uncharacterized protein N7466_010024 [Penicillium verhagenii]KAJ5919081.1 hypothetical protein N7466_010024 [Penicillium verhagenii]